MSTLPQYEGYQPEDEVVEGFVDGQQPPQLTVIEGELAKHSLPTADEAASPPENYRHDWLRAQAALTNQDAFEALYKEYHGFIRLKASSYFMQGGDAQDLIQEGTIGFYKGIRDYDGQQSSLRNFLDLCVTRQILTAVKTASRKKHEPLNQSVSFESTPVGLETGIDLTLKDILSDQSPSPQDAVIGSEGLRDLVTVMSTKLSALESIVLSLYMDGESYEVIAQHIGANTKTVDNALQRVKGKIERHLRVSNDPASISQRHVSDDTSVSKQERAKLGQVFDDWLDGVYSQSGDNLSDAVAALKNRPEANGAVLREVRGYVALIAQDSGWPNPLNAYREACQAVKHRARELSAGDRLPGVYITDVLIEAALSAVQKADRPV